jgi:hypothetical protein
MTTRALWIIAVATTVAANALYAQDIAGAWQGTRAAGIGNLNGVHRCAI